MDRCIADHDLERFHAGDLSAEQSAEIRKHLDACETCRRHDAEFVADHEDLVRQLQAVDEVRGAAETLSTLGVSRPANAEWTPNRPPADSFPGYEIVREIHRGGQGAVYLAVQKATKRKVAIKVMHEGPFAGRRDKARFEREVQILATLKHPNIVAIHDSGTAGGQFFYVMDYISGQPLDQHVQGFEKSKNGPVDIPGLLKLFAKICDAVNAAHLKGVIHRDLKPGNIRIDANGEPQVLDFGLAKLVTGGLTDASRPQAMTMTGQFIGSMPWASPEQAEGAPDKIDIRTDVYSLGVILYEMLTGRFPYDVVGNMRDVLDNILRAEPARPSTIRRQINDEVETMVLKCLAKERERRYQTAGDLAQDIRRYLAGEPIEAKRDSTWYVLRKTLRRYRVPTAVAASLFVLVTASSAALWVMYQNQSIAVLATTRERQRAEAALARVEQERGQRQVHEAATRDLLLRDLDEAALLIDADGIDQHLDRSVAVGIDPSTFHTYRAFAHTIRLDWQDALADEDKAVRLNPRNALAHYLRAINHSHHGRDALCLKDFTITMFFDQKSDVEVAGRGMVKLGLGDYEAGMADLDDLAKRLHGRPAGLWLRGFARWYVLLKGAHRRIEDRWDLSQDALEDVGAAAKLYPRRVPFILDVRADLLFRMCLMESARGEVEDARDFLDRAATDANELIKMGAAGAGYLHLAAFALHEQNLMAASDALDRAYVDLADRTKARSFNAETALAVCGQFRIWVSYLRSSRADTFKLMNRMVEKQPELRNTFGYGVVSGALDHDVEFNAAPAEFGHSSSHDYNLGLWVGACLRGDIRAAQVVADSLSVEPPGVLDGLSASDSLERFRWKQTMLGFLQGGDNGEALLSVSQRSANYYNRAQLALAMRAESAAVRETHLRQIAACAHPDYAWIVATGLLTANTERAQPAP